MKLGDITRESRETFKGDKTGIPIVGLEHLIPQELTFSAYDVDTDNTFTKMFHKGQILFGRRRAYLKKAAVAEFDGICSGDITVIEAIPGKVDKDLLPFIIQNDALFDYAVSRSAGGLSPRVKWEQLSDYEINLPPIEDQKVLADKLWAAYRLKEGYKKLLCATDEMVKSQFIEMFKNIPSVKIADCCITVSGGTPNTKKIEYYDGGDIPWLSSGEINQGYIFSTDKYITQLGLENSSAKWVPANSVVIAMYGATAGKVGFIKIPLTTNQAVCTLLPNDGFEPLYLYYATLSKTSWMISQCRGAAQPNISQSIIRSMEIPMATIDEQKRFCKLLTQADKSKFGDFKSQFIEMFGNPLSLNQKNELKRLGECCILNPRRPNIALCDTDKVSFIPMPAVSEDGYLVDMTDEEYGKVKKGFTYFENNDVLFAKITPCMENGKGAIVHGLTNGIGMGSTEFHVLRPINGISSPYWLLALTRMPIFRERAAKNMSGTGGQKRVSASYLDHFMVGLPAIEEQRRFEAIYKQADKSKSYVRIALKNLESILGYCIRQVA